jgi:hypothetical protein
MRDAQRAAVRELGHARKRFADYARARFGLPEVDLFSQVEQPKQKWPLSPAGMEPTPPLRQHFLLTAAKVSN